MTTIIPAPSYAKASDGNAVVLDADAWIESGPDTSLAANWLRQGLKDFANLQVGDQAGSGTRIRLHVGDVNQLVPITTGVRADGSVAHSEGYQISTGDGEIVITGMTPEAVFRGATSFVQQVSQSAAAGTATLEASVIADAPRLAWRGLSLDVVRCFHPVSTVKKVIDTLAFYKMNVLHLHLTDTEGWRFQVDSWPKLTEISGKTARGDRTGGYYTTAEFAEIVDYASDRYVTVVPEFDSPGHTASVLAAYPELAEQSIHDMSEHMHYLHPDQPDVPTLINDVYTAMAAATNGKFIHIGGDEAIAMDHESFQRYIQMALPIARSTGKGLVAWQEAARGGLAEGDLLQIWIPEYLINKVKQRKENPTPEDVEAMKDPVTAAFVELFSTADEDLGLGLEQGANIILSPGTQLYLDTTYPEPSADPAQNDQHARVGMKSDNYGNGTVEDSYDWDPVSILPELPSNRIAGVEAAIWCETIEDESDLFFQLLPRLAGVAEKAWSEHREWSDHRERLAAQPLFWDVMGLTYFRSSVVWTD